MEVDNLNHQQIRQIRLNALTAKYIHKKKIHQWKLYNLIIDIITLIIPLLLLIFPILQIELIFGLSIHGLSGVLSVLLITLAVLKLIIKIPDKIENHQMLLSKNIEVAQEAENILLNSPSRANFDWLFQQSKGLEAEDQEMIGNVKKEMKQEAYRESLKEFEPGNNSIVCPVCQASPWHFRKGSCEACGNTPAKIV